MKKFILFLVILFVVHLIGINTVSQYLEAEQNPVKAAEPYQVSPKAQAIYDRLDFISDLHSDALLWGRNLNKKGNQGHVDFPRMREANVALEMFTIVFNSPADQNMQSNCEDAFDNIPPLTIAKGESPWNWFSLINRTLSQSEALKYFMENEDEKTIFVRSKADLEKLIEVRITDKLIAGFTDEDINAVMGENVNRFLLENLT